MKSIDIIRKIKNKIRFQAADGEDNAHYTLRGKYLIRISDSSFTNVARIKGYMEKNIDKNPFFKSLVFSDIPVNFEPDHSINMNCSEHFFNAPEMDDKDVDNVIDFIISLSDNSFDKAFNEVADICPISYYYKENGEVWIGKKMNFK